MLPSYLLTIAKPVACFSNLFGATSKHALENVYCKTMSDFLSFNFLTLVLFTMNRSPKQLSRKSTLKEPL
jgi:hypothetical protein